MVAESGLSACVAGVGSDAVIGERSEKKTMRKGSCMRRGVGGEVGGIYYRKS